MSERVGSFTTDLALENLVTNTTGQVVPRSVSACRVVAAVQWTALTLKPTAALTLNVKKSQGG